MFPLADSETLNDPFAYFAECRRTTPIFFHKEWNAWFVFRQDDIGALLRDARLSAQRMDMFTAAAPEELRGALSFLETELRSMVVMLDGATHHHVRQNLQRGFTPRMIHELEPRITAHVAALIDGLRGRDACDLATEVCRQLPLLVLADLFALPEEDFPKLARWGRDFIEYFNRQPVPEEFARGLIRGGREMMEYTKELIAQRRATAGSDLISALVQAQGEGDGLSDQEIVANVMMVLIAGNDTVGSALGNAIHLLLSYPEQLAKVEAGEVSWEDAFEEALRYEPANPVIMRKVAESFDYAGQAFEAGQLIFLALASGSRDEAAVARGEEFLVGREKTKHLTFGGGVHFCIGAALARAEAATLLPQVFQRLRGLRVDPRESAVWLRTLGVRGPSVLPVVYDAVQ